MTLKYEGKKPIGLDWSVCTDGQNRPDVWRNPIAVAEALKSCEQENARSVSDDRRKVRSDRLPKATEILVIGLYRDEKKSALEISREVGIQPATVFKVLDRNGVPTRTQSEAMKLSRAKRRARA